MICPFNEHFVTLYIPPVNQCDNVYVAHASVTPDQPKYDYNTTITYTCDRAYNHTSGDLVRTCDDTPRWTGILPICTRM
ncbi:hypothetical protein DPMN_024168 [Dreissena polymorpha]|uniref:Sushi domain-containing protein n=1 Tax=Dreissena polymorpha TaxID=45954 RepID=A0A9D4RAJ1_DREPO|nr:hypothetical protein DPMN_024168 [Dreissena polymorpha]